MTLHTPVFVQPTAGDANFPNGIPFSAQELRRNTQALLSVISPALQNGVTPLDGQFAVSQHASGANFSVDVATGYAFVVGTDVANQSAYGCWNDAVVNVAVPNPPASGTEVHRLVLRVEDKFNNALWTGYTANLALLADTGSGTPAAPASSVTLALISVSAGQASVLNANITDQRPMLPLPGDALTVRKATDLTRTTVTLSIDPDLQLPLAANATYRVLANIPYSTGANGMKIGWTIPAGAGGIYSAAGTGNTDGNLWTDTPTFGSANPGGLIVAGMITTTSAGTFGLQWASNTGATSLTVRAASFLELRRIA